MYAPLISVAYAAEGGSGGMPQFDATHFPSQILWLAAAVVVLHFLLSKILLPRVHENVATREQAIIGDLERAEELHRTGEELAEKIAERHQETLAAVNRIAAEAKEAVSREIEREQQEAAARLSERTEAGERRIRALRDGLLGRKAAEGAGLAEDDETRRKTAAQVEEIARETAAALIEKIQGKSADAATVADAVRSRTQELR